MRYVNRQCEVCEEFLGFTKVSKMDAESIADAIVSTVKQWVLICPA